MSSLIRAAMTSGLGSFRINFASGRWADFAIEAVGKRRHLLHRLRARLDAEGSGTAHRRDDGRRMSALSTAMNERDAGLNGAGSGGDGASRSEGAAGACFVAPIP